jgi:hypothetical protein
MYEVIQKYSMFTPGIFAIELKIFKLVGRERISFGFRFEYAN